jgi:hypothetical protein
MKRFAACAGLIVLAALSACTTTEEALTAARSKYIGTNADRFWLANGPPARSHTLSDGSTLYTWVGGTKFYNTPAVTTVNMSPSIGGGVMGTATTTGGSTVAIGCALELHVDTKGIVRGIRAVDDTIGAWELSRCAEILRRAG